MFGYVRCIPPKLSPADYGLYQSFYCGLCRQTSKRFGAWSRLTLSYDLTFLAIFHAALQGESSGETVNTPCGVLPFLTKPSNQNQSSVDFAAEVGLLLLYHKLIDNLADHTGPRRLPDLALFALSKKARGKTEGRYPDLDLAFAQTTRQQQILEANQCACVDEICAPSGQGLACVFASLSDDPGQSKFLGRFGFLLGRWVYLIDAVDDFEGDQKRQNFNIWHNLFPKATTREAIAPAARRSLNRTLGALAAVYDQIHLLHFQELIDHIVFLGLPVMQEQVLTKSANHPKPEEERNA